jgi:hypothetical protein
MKVKKKRSGAPSQHERFKEMARELGADESPATFDRTLKRIVPGKPAPVPAKKSARAK